MGDNNDALKAVCVLHQNYNNITGHISFSSCKFYCLVLVHLPLIVLFVPMSCIALLKIS